MPLPDFLAVLMAWSIIGVCQWMHERAKKRAESERDHMIQQAFMTMHQKLERELFEAAKQHDAERRRIRDGYLDRLSAPKPEKRKNDHIVIDGEQWEVIETDE